MTNISTERLEEMRPCPFCGVSLVLTEQEEWVHPWDDVCPAEDIHIHHRDEPRINAWNRRSLDKGEVVKQLEWGEEERGVRRQVFGIRANTPIGQYFIEDMGPSAKEGRRYALQHDQMLTQWHSYYEEAKAAAQADFETRIRSALVSQPAPKGVEITEHGQPHAMDSAPFDRTILVWWPIVAVDDETGDLTDTEVDGRWLVTEWNGDYWLEPDGLNALNSNYFDDDCEYARSPKCWLPLPAAIEAMKEASNG